MSRLPQPGSDDGVWGDVLNDFLLQAHNSDGSLRQLSQAQITGLSAAMAAKAAAADLTAHQTANDPHADRAYADELQLLRPRSIWRSGQYYSAEGSSVTFTGFMEGRLSLTPLWVPHATSVSAMGFWINAAATSGIARLGIYNANQSTFEPTTLLAETVVTVPVTSTGGHEAAFAAAVPLDARLYYLAIVNQGLTGTLNMNCYSRSMHPIPGASNLDIARVANERWMPNVSGSLPSVWAGTNSERRARVLSVRVA